MDISALKDKLGDDFAKLEAFVSDLTGQRDAARKESIDGRKGLKGELERLKALQAKLFDRLGIADEDDLETLPDFKGQAEAAKVYEAKLKRMERELGEKTQALSEAETRYRESRQSAQLTRALQAYDWVDREIVELALTRNLVWEGDELFFRAAPNAAPVSLDDGVKRFALDKPSLLKSNGAGGSGYHPTGNGKAPNPWAKESFNLTEQGKLLTANPALAEAMKQSAQAAPN